MTAQVRRQAFRLGLATYVACLLTSALFAAPLLAAEFDFNHRHSDGTPPHVHTINGIIGNVALTGPVAEAGFFSLSLYRLPHLDVVPPQAFTPTGPNIRAPPHG